MHWNAENVIGSNPNLWILVCVYWFVTLFQPEILLSFYIPSLAMIRALPTVLLILVVGMWLFSSVKKHGYTLLLVFLIVLCISGLFAENTGRARTIIRIVLDYYLIAQITFSVASRPERVKRLNTLYLMHIAYMFAWGLVSFAMVNRGIVVWEVTTLNEEDAFGPLMAIGAFYASQQFYSQNNTAIRKKFCFLVFLAGISGAILSFARGAFISLVFGVLCLASMSKQKFRSLLNLSLLFVFALAVAGIFFGGTYWNEMKSITEGSGDSTGQDRMILWSIAWEEAKHNPIFGVGPGNFGVAAPRYVAKVKDQYRYRTDNIWGRALHSVFFQIISELGLMGVLVFFALIIDFYRKNRSIPRLVNRTKDGVDFALDVSNSLMLAMGVYLVNAFFYDITYYNWFWHLLILNRLVYLTWYSDPQKTS